MTTKLPAWIEADYETVRRDNTPVIATYHRALDAARARLDGFDTDDELRQHLYVWHHSLTEHAQRCLNALNQHHHAEQKPRAGKYRIPESAGWLGWVPHSLAAGLGWRVWLGCALAERLWGHPTIMSDYYATADTFLVRAQAMLDAHNAIGRAASRTTDAAVDVMRLLVGDYVKAVEHLARIAKLSAYEVDLPQFDDALASVRWK